jgi:hypothetical protein
MFKHITSKFTNILNFYSTFYLVKIPIGEVKGLICVYDCFITMDMGHM